MNMGYISLDYMSFKLQISSGYIPLLNVTLLIVYPFPRVKTTNPAIFPSLDTSSLGKVKALTVARSQAFLHSLLKSCKPIFGSALYQTEILLHHTDHPFYKIKYDCVSVC